jgi:very-short-patch-repair endonuclease
MVRRVDPRLTARARELRNNPTPAELAIELDGSQHIEAAVADEQRTAYLRERGWRVIRLWNSEVLANPDGAAQYILSTAAECLGGTHPHPLPSREGRARRPRYR